MNQDVFKKIWRTLKAQVQSLHVPWIDKMSSRRRDPFQVLISCLLSLRTQDRTTEEASRRLFRLARTPRKMSVLPVARIQQAIYPVGFYRVKAKRIRDISKALLRQYGGSVPQSIDELLLLKGVGRKTANLVITLGYDRDGICVDTHVHRITNRWGLVKARTPAQTEFALRETLPRAYWKKLNSYLVAFGQEICKPISPHCSLCRVRRFCPRLGVGRSR